MLRTVDLEIVGRTTAHQRHGGNHQKIADRKGCVFFRFRLRLGNRFRVRFWLDNRLCYFGLRVCFCESQKVFFRDSVQKIHIVLSALTVNDQIKHIFAGGGNRKKFLAVLVGSIIHHRTRSIWGEGLSSGFLGSRRLGFCNGLVTLGVGCGAHAGKRKQGGSQNRSPAKKLILHVRYPPLLHQTSGQVGPKR